MLTEIRETERAVAYLCLAVIDKFPEGQVDVTLYRDGHVPSMHQIVSRGELRVLLERLCRHFPESSVFLDLDEKRPPTAAVSCRCRTSLRELCRRPCQHLGDRPTVIIVARGSDLASTEECSRRGLSLFHRALVDQVRDLKRRRLSSKRNGKGRDSCQRGRHARHV